MALNPEWEEKVRALAIRCLMVEATYGKLHRGHTKAKVSEEWLSYLLQIPHRHDKYNIFLNRVEEAERAQYGTSTVTEETK